MTEAPDTFARPAAGLAILPLWALLIAVEVGAQLSLKEGAAALGDMPFGMDWMLQAAAMPLVLLSALLYVASFLVWIAILARMPVSQAFPLTAVVQVAVVLSSVFILGEGFGPWRGVGVGFILAGVLLLGRD